MKECLSSDDHQKLSVGPTEIIKILAFVHVSIHYRLLHFDYVRLDVLAQVNEDMLQVPAKF